MLKLIGIKKDYKVADTAVPALKGIDLAFRKNEFVCILGQSGCGKTTLLNIIGGLDQYTSGDLVIEGKSTKNYSDRDWDVYRNHRIGFIFQSYNLIPHQTVLGNVEIALTIAGIGKEERRERAKQALERVGLGGELDKRPNQLSGGQMQRVAIARALVNNPAILLADEPTGALDSATSVQIMDLIREISGERLVIMVTHNPELAEQYASRIVRLKDGLVEADSNPYDGAGEVPEAEEEPVPADKKQARALKKEKKKKAARARMNFLSALALSARNLLTKKGRTIITSIAGSIGIISVCLVLALSSGFSNYIRRTEEDMLSYYPLEITESSMDVTAIMSGVSSAGNMPDLSELDNKVYVNSFLTGLAKGMAVKNNISDEYLEYIGNMDENLYYAVQYAYGVTLTDNIFTQVRTYPQNGETPDADGQKAHNMSLSNLKQFYIDELTQKADEYSGLVYMANFFGNIVNKMPGTADFNDARYSEYVLSQYDVLAGQFPKGTNEALLVIGDNNDLTDLTLAQLGFLDEQTFLSLFDLGKDENADINKYETIAFDDILEKQFTLFYNDAVYTENASYNPMLPTDYKFTYSGDRPELTAKEGEGVNIRISGILRLKDGLTYGCLSDGLNLTEKLVEDYIAVNMESALVKWMKEEAKINNPMLGDTVLYRSPAAHLNEDNYTSAEQLGGMFVNYSQESALRSVGGDNRVNAVSIYPKDFDSKDDVLAYLDAWNANAESEADKVTYTDRVGLLMGMVQTMLNAVTYVLVAFTAISLVVSSVMIGIITYVSVVERVKEIGVLRSLGARKRDIKNLFNAETFIIGLAAGLIGVLVTYLLSFAVNAILFALTGIANLAALPVTSALVMVVISVLLTLISGLIPASAAAKKDPVIALRTE